MDWGIVDALGKDTRDVYFLLSRLGTSDGGTATGATGDVGATAVRTCFGFFASLLPRWPLDMIVPSSVMRSGCAGHECMAMG